MPALEARQSSFRSFAAFLDARVAEAQRLRERIQGMGASDDVPEKARLLRDAEEAIADVRLIGDVVVSAFFERDKPQGPRDAPRGLRRQDRDVAGQL